jgi:hypothetical protein
MMKRRAARGIFHQRTSKIFHEAEDAGNIPVGEKVLGLGKMFRKE